ncbi:MAG: P-II family nitrogen regulator [Desulfovibrio sp.]|jgi:nitrogen regulatory protein P-II 1|nr:P-II family nitrogen regulator [Desulfovibrio sp.]
MKLIIAFIRPEALQKVKHELYLKEIYSVSVTNILGAGRQKGYTELYRGVTTQVTLLKKARLEIGVPDDKVDAVIEAITTGARTGKEGDGVFFVLDVARAGRIRTGEAM